MDLDFSKRSSALILDLVNIKSKRAFLPNEVYFSDVQDESENEETIRNTSIVLTATEVNEQLAGSGQIFYDRIDLTALFAPVEKAMVVDEKMASDIPTVLEMINARFNLGLSEEDFDFSAATSIDYVLTIPTKEDGLVYTGNLVLTVEPDVWTIEYLMGNALLDGFVPPVLEWDESVN